MTTKMFPISCLVGGFLISTFTVKVSYTELGWWWCLIFALIVLFAGWLIDALVEEDQNKGKR